MSAGTITQIALTGYATAVATGGTVSVTATAQDAGGNTVTANTDALTITSSDGSAILPSPSFVAGVATFNTTLVSIGSGTQTITVTDAAHPTIHTTTSAITINAGPDNKLAFQQQPSAAVFAGSALGTQPIVQIQDVNGNLTTSTSTVTLALYSNVGCTIAAGGLSGTNALAAISGSSTFSGLTISSPGTYYLKATAGVLTSACSSAIAVSPGAPHHLSFAGTLSVTSTAGTPLTVQPVVTIYDIGNNVVTSASTALTISLWWIY